MYAKHTVTYATVLYSPQAYRKITLDLSINETHIWPGAL